MSIAPTCTRRWLRSTARCGPAASCSTPVHPERKGQVERTNGYLEGSFLPLRSFSGRTDLQAQSDEWAEEVAWRRHHRRVGARVGDALAVERTFLRAMPDPLPDVGQHLEARVMRDAFVRVTGADYSVPPAYSGRRVQVRLTPTELEVFADGKPIAHHARSFVPADVVLAPAHARALRLAREATGRLAGGDVELPEVDLARYDALAEVSA